MSMKDYGFDDYGFILTEDVIHILAPQICEDYSEKDWELRGSSYYIEDIYDRVGAGYVCNFTGEIVAVTDDGKDDYSDTIWRGMNNIYYISIRKYPSLFDASYKDMDEILDEFKEVLSKYLPEDYNYRKNFKHIIGSYWG